MNFKLSKMITHKKSNKNSKKIYETLRIIAWICFILYLFIIAYLMLFGRNINIPNSSGQRSYNLIPFKTIMNYIINFNRFNLNTVIINLIGNIAVFIPLGIFLPVLIQRMRKYKILIMTCTVLISIAEILQLIFRVGSLDIDDLILNLIGCSIGFLCYQAFIKHIKNYM